MVRPARFRAICSALGDVEERPHFERTAFRTPARTFATLGPTGKDVNVLVPPEVQQVLVDSQPKVFAPVKGAWGARGWTRMELSRVDEPTCREVLREAHALAAPKAKARPKASAKAKAKPKAKPSPSRSQPKEAEDADMDALEEILGPSIRAYADEELRILKLASKHPKLGAKFVSEMATSDAAVPKKYRAAFRDAMKDVDVAARARAVVKKMETYWGTPLDAETKDEIRADVAAMYRGDGSSE